MRSKQEAKELLELTYDFQFSPKIPGSVLCHHGEATLYAKVISAEKLSESNINQVIVQVSQDNNITTLSAESLIAAGNLLAAAIDEKIADKHKFVISIQLLTGAELLFSTVINAAFITLKGYLIREYGVAKIGTICELGAVTAGVVGEDTILDLSPAELKQATNWLTVIRDEQGYFYQLLTGGLERFSGSDLNELLFLTSQGAEEVIGIGEGALVKQYQPVSLSKQIAGQILVATRNQGKAEEFKAVFEPRGFLVKTLLDYPEIPDVVETGKTFLENAKLKADTIADIIQTPVIADDSGLMVDALGGRPGVHSARYAGDHNDNANNAKLLYELTGVPDAKRTATFHTTLVMAYPNKPEADLVVSGDVNGSILRIPRGDNGFGYDPLFFIPELDRSMAELTANEKNQISHRGRAMAQLQSQWQDWLKEVDTK